MTHKSYLKNSPTYADAYDRHGAWLPERVAVRFAADHGFTLADLEGLRRKGDTVGTLSLFEALGY